MTALPAHIVLVKVASLLQAIDATPLNAPLDVGAIRAQLADRDVSKWLDDAWREVRAGQQGKETRI
jgi:hypothetical protein